MPETGGKCWCKADVPLVIEEMIREFLSKQDPELEESDRNHRKLKILGWKGLKDDQIPTPLLWAGLSHCRSGCLGPLTS